MSRAPSSRGPGVPRRLAWPPGDGVVLVSGPLALAPHTGQRIEVDVPPGHVALVIEDHEVVGLLLPRRHELQVVGPHDAPFLFPRLDAEANRGGAPLGTSIPEMRALAARVVLLLIADQTPLAFAWGASGALRRDHSEGGGRASVRVCDPIRFYGAFLRHTEDLGERRLRRFLAAFLQTHLERPVALRPRTGRARTRLARRGATAVELSVRELVVRRLARLGLQLLELESNLPLAIVPRGHEVVAPPSAG